MSEQEEEEHPGYYYTPAEESEPETRVKTLENGITHIITIPKWFWRVGDEMDSSDISGFSYKQRIPFCLGVAKEHGGCFIQTFKYSIYRAYQYYYKDMNGVTNQWWNPELDKLLEE
jgi:hypothetical protein